MFDFDKETAIVLLNGLTVYRRILKDDAVSALVSGEFHSFIGLILEKSHALGLDGNLVEQYFSHLLLQDENAFSLACEKGWNIKGTALYKYAVKDIEALSFFAKIKPDFIIENYKNCGVGDLARFRAFIMNENGGLDGIKKPDPITFDDIIGIEYQKATLIENTIAFLAGKPANNVLLAGSRGNGKSSCVKALLNKYHEDRLRLIEVRKDQMRLLPRLIKKLEDRGKYFIVFMDDLSFERSETDYKYFKSMLEGGLCAQPDNVLFYATSNRRHIIKESWKDRNSDDELHINDTINEMISLSDRFGLTLNFPHINQDEYLEIVNRLAERRGIQIEEADALRWSAEHKRMSGRTAVQFLRNKMNT